MKINWKIRLRNKAWLTAVLALTVSFLYDLAELLGWAPAFTEEWVLHLIQTGLTLLTALGVVIDPTTEGASDSERAMGYGR